MGSGGIRKGLKPAKGDWEPSLTPGPTGSPQQAHDAVVAQLRKGVAEWSLSRYLYLTAAVGFAELLAMVSRLESWYRIGDRP